MEIVNNIQRHRQAVRDNIMKSFGVDDSFAELEVFKGEENDIEKAKWSVGDTKVYQGVTWEVGGFNAKGTPLWRKKKDQSGSSSGGASAASNSNQSQAQANQQTAKKPASKTTNGGNQKEIAAIEKKIADYKKRIDERTWQYYKYKREQQKALSSILINKYLKFSNIAAASLRKLQQGLRKQENKLIELKKNLQNKTGEVTSKLTDPGSDNYKTASEKTGRKNPGRSSYGWKNSAAGYDAKELDNE